MDVLSDEQFEIMGFIAICNRRNYQPTEEEVMIWRQNPNPRPAKYRRRSSPPPPNIANAIAQLSNVDVSAALRPAMLQAISTLSTSSANWKPWLEWATGGVQELERPAETTISHLVRLTWLQEVRSARADRVGLRLTDLGHALYSDVELNDVSEDDVSVVVLGKDDPLAYHVLIGRLAQVGAGLMVDPYLKLDGLHHLVTSTQLTRILVSDKGKQQAGEVKAMTTYLDSPLISRDIEVRVSKSLHDRVVVADEGDVFTLGSSLNGVGRKTTVFSPVPGLAADALADEFETLWDEADLVGPTPPVESEDPDESMAGDAEGSADATS